MSGRPSALAGHAPGRRAADRHSLREGLPGGLVYVLELAGQNDDELARLEAASCCSAVTPLAPGLATAREVSERARTLALTHTACRQVGTCEPTVEAARALLERAAPDPDGSASVRARDVRGLAGVSTRRAERALGGVLSELGWAIDLETPARELRVLFSADLCAVGWVAVRTDRAFRARRPTARPFFQPGSMAPMFARAMANIAGARPGARILDPMCGTGGLALEAGLLGASVLGTDVQWKMVRGTRQNLAWGLPAGADWQAVRADVRALPIQDARLTGAVFDAPYGRQSKVIGRLDALIGAALSETARVTDRLVLIADRSWAGVARDRGWTVSAQLERPVHGSLTRFVHLLERGAGEHNRPNG